MNVRTFKPCTVTDDAAVRAYNHSRLPMLSRPSAGLECCSTLRRIPRCRCRGRASLHLLPPATALRLLLHKVGTIPHAQTRALHRCLRKGMSPEECDASSECAHVSTTEVACYRTERILIGAPRQRVLAFTKTKVDGGSRHRP